MECVRPTYDLIFQIYVKIFFFLDGDKGSGTKHFLPEKRVFIERQYFFSVIDT